MRVNRQFFKRDALIVAQELLGMFLCRNIDGIIYKCKIAETECYRGKDDSASHAGRGKTKRNKVMFRQGGYAYVYLCYGLHCMFNIVTGQKNTPQAVLIRAVENHIGPGKLTAALKIGMSLNNEDLTKSDLIWLEHSQAVPRYISTKRIGISYAKQKDQDRLWRFVIE